MRGRAGRPVRDARNGLILPPIAPRALSGQMDAFDRDYFASWSSTYFHRRVIHMIAFHGLRVGGGAPATLAPPEASPRRVSGHPPSAAAATVRPTTLEGGKAPLLRRTGRQAAPTPSGGHDMRPFGRPCGSLGRRRAALVMGSHHGGPRSWPKNPQGRRMCHPPMKVRTRATISFTGPSSGTHTGNGPRCRDLI